MNLFVNGQLIWHEIPKEDKLTDIKIIVPREHLLKEDGKYYNSATRKAEDVIVKDKIYTLQYHHNYKGYKDFTGYIFVQTQSPYNDNSGLDNGIDGYYNRMGEAIASARKWYKDFIYVDGKKLD